MSCYVLFVGDGESMHSSTFANDGLALGCIYNVDTRCVPHCLDQVGNVFQDIEISDRTKRHSLFTSYFNHSPRENW